MRWTGTKLTVHGLLLACALVAGACSSNETGGPANTGGSGGPGTGGRGGTGGSTGSPTGGSTGGSGTGGTTGGSGTGGTTGGSGGGQADAPGPEFETGAPTGAPKLCGEIRNCVVRCTNAACTQACIDQAPAPARAKYAEVTTCSKAGCAETDISCRCERECLEPGPCVSKVDECREGVQDDTFCDEQCH